MNTRAQMKRNEELKEKRAKVQAERNKILQLEGEKQSWKTIAGAEIKLVSLEEKYKKMVIESRPRNIRIKMDVYEKQIKELNLLSIREKKSDNEIIPIDSDDGKKTEGNNQKDGDEITVMSDLTVKAMNSINQFNTTSTIRNENRETPKLESLGKTRNAEAKEKENTSKEIKKVPLEDNSKFSWGMQDDGATVMSNVTNETIETSGKGGKATTYASGENTQLNKGTKNKNNNNINEKEEKQNDDPKKIENEKVKTSETKDENVVAGKVDSIKENKDLENQNGKNVKAKGNTK